MSFRLFILLWRQEGVETQEQLKIVKSLGYDIVQGYFYSPPRPAGEITMRYFPAKDNIKIVEVA